MLFWRRLQPIWTWMRAIAGFLIAASGKSLYPTKKKIGAYPGQNAFDASRKSR
jgi:hypothetical protein